MIHSVSWLDDPSQMVRPACGLVDDGMTNGNSAKPTVRITPVIDSDDARNASMLARTVKSSTTSSAPATPSAGAIHIKGQVA
ncbi:hypothetical protein D3C78_1492080 [compost metagenome]